MKWQKLLKIENKRGGIEMVMDKESTICINGLMK